ncbi:MAG: type II toxin-antitoxin system RelE/ParE family toxin [Chitinophagia bacterium]|nr:type II toxin-antitoxin system RelE/ParE family toxin [Chitinophagia bacterium]
MKYQIMYLEEALLDVKEAKEWYKNQKQGLQKTFAYDIKNTILRLLMNPYIHAVRYKNVRLANATIFPYAVYYFIDDNAHKIVIIGILHNHRNPLVPKNRV